MGDVGAAELDGVGELRRAEDVVDPRRRRGPLHTDRVAAARELLAQVEDLAGARPAVWIELNLRHARGLLVRDNAQAQRRFDDALGTDLGRWPFHRARLLLTHGEWLRRQRRIADSRTPLRAARDLFDTLGCMSWSERARRELRASGESSRRVQGRRRWFLRDAEPSPLSHVLGWLMRRDVPTGLFRTLTCVPAAK